MSTLNNTQKKTAEIEILSGDAIGQNIAKYDKKTDSGSAERCGMLYACLIGLTTYEQFSKFRGEFKSGYVKAKKCDVESAGKAFRRWFKSMNNCEVNGKKPYQYDAPTQIIQAASEIKADNRAKKKETAEQKAQKKIADNQKSNLKSARAKRDRLSGMLQTYIDKKR